MFTKSKTETVNCKYFVWGLRERKGVWQADGRGNKPSLNRHSLNTRDRAEALENLTRLDLVMAVKIGKADPSALNASAAAPLPLDKGVEIYLQHVKRPLITGGAKASTPKRYKAVLDKAVPFFRGSGIDTWNQIKKNHVKSYAAWLDGEGYAYATEFLELTTLKQAMNFFTTDGYLPMDCRIVMPLAKPTETDTYCWRPEEVTAIVQHCRAEMLDWLADVFVALICTGMRISELATLRWPDIDFAANVIQLKDETRSGKIGRSEARSIKNRRGRSFPIHEQLHLVLNRLRRHDSVGAVFVGPHGGSIKPDFVRSTLVKRVLEPLQCRFPTPDGEVGFRDGRLHSCRHYFCSLCASSGVAEQVVMRWLGHRNSNMVKRYYHLFDAESQRQMQKLKFIDAVDGA